MALALMLSLGTSAFANERPLSLNTMSAQELQNLSTLDANDLDKIKVALDGIEVNNENKVVKHVFPDGSSIRVSVDVTPVATEGSSLLVAETQYDATVSMSGESAVTGITMWTYTLHQSYKSNGTKVTWYENSPYSTFNKPIISLWGVDSETFSTSSNPGYPGGIWATGTVKLSWDIWEGNNIQPINIKLTLSIKGDGTYTGYTKWL